MDRSRILCQSCLSDDRKLSVIGGSVLELFLYLLGSKTLISTPVSVALCWECAALLRAVQRFLKRTEKAQIVLQSLHNTRNTTTVQCLSTLSVVLPPTQPALTVKEEDTATDEHSLKTDIVERKDLPITYLPFNDPDVKQTHEGEPFILPKEESNEYEDDFVRNDKDFEAAAFSDAVDFITDAGGKKVTVKTMKNKLNDRLSDGDVKEEVEIVKKDREKEKKKSKSYRNILGKAKVIVNPELDTDNLDKHYTTVYLDESEVSSTSNTEESRKLNKYKCKKCKLRFKFKWFLRSHFNVSHNSMTAPPYECLKCKASVRALPELESHWREHCAMLRCNFCGATARRAPAMRRHLLSHSHVLKCRECAASFLFKNDYVKHFSQLHRKLICDYCGKQFHDKSDIVKHIRRNHVPHKCEYCSRTYTKNSGLRKHQLEGCTWARRRGLADTGTKSDPKELAYCVECDRQYPTVSQFRAHLWTSPVHTKRPYKYKRCHCPECGKVMKSAAYMLDHMAVIHQKGRSKFYCELCDKNYSSKYALGNHQRSYHDKVRQPKDKKCDICGRGFAVNRTLVHHIRTHTGDRPYACTQCTASFAQPIALQTHMRSRHNLAGVKIRHLKVDKLGAL